MSNDSTPDWIWHKYFMGIALLSELRSKDEIRQVGACVVNNERQVIGIGYNGMPLNCHDSLMPWNDKIKMTKLKHYYVCHAELNAIVNKNPKSVKGCTVYVTLFPCNECAKVIARSGITTVVYLSDDKHKAKFQASKYILDNLAITCKKFDDLVSEEQLRAKVKTIVFDGVQVQAPEPGVKWKDPEKKIITWEQYFMGLAILSGMLRSEDSEEGACAVDKNKRIVGLGYVQKVVDPPTEEKADELRKTASEKEKQEDKQDVTDRSFYVSHAPVNAIVNKSPSSLQGCTMYVVQYPCNECAKVIVQSGIQRIVYLKKKTSKHEKVENTKKQENETSTQEKGRETSDLKKEKETSDSLQATSRMFAIAHIKEKQYKEQSKTDMLSVDFTPAPRE